MKNLFQISLTVGITAIQLALPFSSHAQIESVPSESATPNSQSGQSPEFAFDFDNTYDYASCLDVILLAYEGRDAELANVSKNDCATNVLNTFGNDLSQDEALQLVKAADLYATETLETPLYPSLGLRRRIAINLGYVYNMDKNNPDILKYVDSES